MKKSAERVVAIIPARGGSKGIPRKNLIEFAGKPLLVHTIEHARMASEISEVIVSTDDSRIAEVATLNGATVVGRPAEISGDEAPSESALTHVLDFLKARDGVDPDLVVFLQATSPIRPPGSISRAIAELVKEGVDSSFSAYSTHGFVWRLDEGDPVSVTYDYRHRPRRQDAPDHVIENGSIYIFRPWVLRETGNRLGGRIGVFLMDSLFSHQIDDVEDVEVAERLLRLITGESETVGSGGDN